MGGGINSLKRRLKRYSRMLPTSALGKVKSFPDNTEIEALLTYTPNDRTGVGLELVVPSPKFP